MRATAKGLERRREDKNDGKRIGTMARWRGLEQERGRFLSEVLRAESEGHLGDLIIACSQNALIYNEFPVPKDP